jgi:TRAP-type uncharacterized transport system substrate-binding protein
VNIFGFTPAQMDTIVQAIPELSKGTIARGTYRTPTADMNILGVYNFAIGHRSLPEDFVFELVKAVMTQNPRMVQATAAARETLAENWNKNTFLPFHPGAAKWFRENGFAIPDNLVMA